MRFTIWRPLRVARPDREKSATSTTVSSPSSSAVSPVSAAADGGAAQGHTECVDIEDGPQTETFFAQDLPRAVSRAYRVGEHARNWGVIGNSTGGYCALKPGLHHTDRFAAGAGLSAYYRAAEDPTLPGHDVTPGRGRPAGTREFIDRVKAPARVSSIVLGSGGRSLRPGVDGCRTQRGPNPGVTVRRPSPRSPPPPRHAGATARPRRSTGAGPRGDGPG
ncbi:alpha/beta hydrolase-fold protein [Streptomyces argenteolus]|uniref:alpha/beta hydrolase-fold protein n=1 Tax=Streptomyces sp. NPDC025273 TaxID=3155251 RepID=UPI0033E51E96